MTEEQQRQYDEAMESLIAYDNEQHEKKMKILDQIKESVSKELYDDILHVIEESDQTDRFEITEEAPDKKHYQKETETEELEGIYVNQYQNGGYEGDSFAGQVWIKFIDNKYLTFHYSM